MPRNLSVAARLAELLEARANCQASGNTEWLERHTETLNEVMRDHLPSGSGIDAGCTLDFLKSTPTCLVFEVPFHCMNQDGYYDGWRTYRVRVRPRFQSIDVAVTGRDYDQIRDYLADVFQEALDRRIDIVDEPECMGHDSAGEPGGCDLPYPRTVYCDGSCRRA